MRSYIRMLLITVLLMVAPVIVAQESAIPPIGMGDSITASRADGEIPRYALSVPANTPTQITLASEAFAPNLKLVSAGRRSSLASTTEFIRGLPYVRLIVNPTQDTNYEIEVAGSGAGEYTLSIGEPYAVQVVEAEHAFELELQPGESVYIALNVRVNDYFLVSYDNRESGNQSLTIDTRTQHGATAGKTWSGASLASSFFIADFNGNMGILIRPPVAMTEATTVMFNIQLLPKLNLDEGLQVAELIGGTQVVLAFNAVANSRYRITFAGADGFPPNLQVMLIQNGEELGTVSLNAKRDAALYAGGSFIINGLSDGEILVVPMLTGRVSELRFNLDVTLEALP